MQRRALILILATLASAAMALSAVQPVIIDLSRWAPPNITDVGQDASGTLTRYGYLLFTDTANQIGPTVADINRRFGGNNLACQNCHLRAGMQPYAMPLIGIQGQFPQYRAREGRIDTLEDRINGCMERSMNGRPLPLDEREMKAFIAFMRWLSNGIPAGARLVGAGTLRIKEPQRVADPARGAGVYRETCSPCHGATGAGVRAKKRSGLSVSAALGRRQL